MTPEQVDLCCQLRDAGWANYEIASETGLPGPQVTRLLAKLARKGICLSQTRARAVARGEEVEAKREDVTQLHVHQAFADASSLRARKDVSLQTAFEQGELA